MAKFFLLNTVLVGTTKLFAGQLVDDTARDTTPITDAGGILLPDDTTGQNIVAAAATKAQAARLRGASEAELDEIMSVAATKEQEIGDEARIKTIVLTIAAAAIAAKGNVMSGTFDAATAFPAGARLLGVESVVGTKVQNAGDTDTTTYAVGTDGAGKSAIGVAAGTTADAGTSGGALGMGRAVGGEKLRLTLTSDVNLSTITAGAFTVTALFAVPAAS